jgi:hypothetical protein
LYFAGSGFSIFKECKNNEDGLWPSFLFCAAAIAGAFVAERDRAWLEFLVLWVF